MQQNLLETPIEYLKGVGPNRGTLLRKELGIHKYGHLLNFFPNRYIKRTRYYKINELQNNVAEAQIIGKMINVKTGKVYGDKVQIISGLNGGEQVITSGQINLENGSKINIVK